jgi:hypothetical protein
VRLQITSEGFIDQPSNALVGGILKIKIELFSPLIRKFDGQLRRLPGQPPHLQNRFQESKSASYQQILMESSGCYGLIRHRTF